MRPKDFLIKQSKSPIVMVLLVGLVAVLFMPPLLPKNAMKVVYNLSPPNRLYAYYSSTTVNDLMDMSFIRQSGSSMLLESGSRIYSLADRDYEAYQDRYCTLPPPKRDWVFIDDIDGDSILEVFYISQENDSVSLYVADNISFKTKRKISLPIVGDMKYHYLRFYYTRGEEEVYFSIGSRNKKIGFETKLFQYHYSTNTLSLVYKCDALLEGFQIAGCDEKILLVKKIGGTSVVVFDKVTKDMVTHILDCKMNKGIYRAKYNVQTFPYHFTNELLLSKQNDSLFVIAPEDLVMEGKMTHHLVFGTSGVKDRLILKYENGKTVFFTVLTNGKSKLYKYNHENGKTSRIRIKGDPSVGNVIFYGDLTGNGKQSIVFTDITNSKEAFCVYQEGSFSNVCRYPIGREKLNVENAVLQKSGFLSFQSKSVEYEILYSKNPEYYKHWLWCGLIFFLIMIMGLLYQKILEIREYRQKEANDKILQLQLENVQKRIDPHFIFNSLNNLGSLILEGESNESYDYLSKVSSVLYKALRNRNILVTIEEELSFCTSVLDTQIQRFKGKFDYEVFIDKGVDMNSLMPSNILNSMADNSIKHGFADIDYLGLISIEFVKKEKGVLVVVEDNGKGRDAAQADKDKTKSTGTGLEICYQYVQLINQDRSSNLLFFDIDDLYDENEEPCGTRCEFYVPNNLE